MNSRHYWPAPLPLGIDLLAVVCAVCHRPLVPMPSPGDWQRRIAEFANRQDCPGNGLGRIEDQNQAEDQTRDPGDTMPAQGWADVAFSSCFNNPDAGRNPATREDSTMAPVEIGRATSAADREDFGKAAERASTVGQFITMTEEGLREELEGRPVGYLRMLADECRQTQRWHEQGAHDAHKLREVVGTILRDASNYADPMETAYAVLGSTEEASR